ncbi:DEAD/DEAH box helicase family protein [Nocardia puris]|uniref:sacsin N-terminal ATP-binding-like domain-containing protein n=1 Tax=Nocardia puris TaxID=208602 RepID=UPI00189451F4|nr:DEAD/DEAH box helicase family protein [Nocardia puris]MBF6216379.1 DEAD/DEAH box helicase family protein [Nocardia puris]MBF6369771.1 DEAD/DEAH box helicase family protein [Nocardia puris]MBF6463430.1 DEAD/DEAH box helicase family protein [Nocardia puris]
MTASQWMPDRALVGELEGLFARAIESYRANPNLVMEHANHEESIRVGGYSNRTLLELVQNAADAMTGTPSTSTDGRVEIVLDLSAGTLYCANAGRPFSSSGLTALAHAHLSGKRGDEIGRFGLGFKSVLSVTDKPQVFSRSVSFEYNSVEANRALREVGAQARRFPVLRTATRIRNIESEFANDPILNELSQWAATIVKLPALRKIANLQKEIKGFRSELLLFVEAVREVHLRVVGVGDEFATSHISHALGHGKFEIERPDGKNSIWYVETSMHSPSSEARREVGEAVSRERVKVTVAMPERFSGLQTGRFWSYFPLQDETTASALFNAPWSVNDDRTTLLHNKYNREIVQTLSSMFVDLLPRVVQADDPAAHLDYMPARGRESLSFGDDLLSAYVPRLAAQSPLVPDGQGRLCLPEELTPLSFFVPDATSRDHEAWIKAPNTGDDVPHWRCYSTPRRIARLRQMYVFSGDAEQVDLRTRDEIKALEHVRTRGILSWLREWATGDTSSAAAALSFVLLHPKIEGIRGAKVIPTTAGLKSLNDRPQVFLKRVDEIELDGSSFVVPEFLMIGGVEKNLREQGFRDLDPESILRARIATLSQASGIHDQEKFWDAVLDIRPDQAARIVQDKNKGHLMVPTVDGGWATPRSVLDIDGLGGGLDGRRLDRNRCVPEVAWAAGVVHEPIANYPFEDELCADRYYDFVLAELNGRLGPGDRGIENVEFDQYSGAGPFSALLLMAESGASEATRADWTRRLLEMDENPRWTCEDVDTQQTWQVLSPVRWAVNTQGLVSSSGGYRPPSQVVSASMLEFQDFLPLYRGPRALEDELALPRNLGDVPADVLREALGQGSFKSRIGDGALATFVLQASKIAYADSNPPQIPAKVGHAIEGRRPGLVYLASNDEQQMLLSQKQKPHLRVPEAEVDEFVSRVGCRRFEDSFSFSTIVEGRQEPDPVVDLYPGLQESWLFDADKLSHAKVARALHIAKRVTTEDGVEDQALPWYLDGLTLVVPNDLSERQILEIVNDAFGLRMSNADLDNVEKMALNQQLEGWRQQARAAKNDAERLSVFFGDDTLRENLPRGLWQALEAQGLVDSSSSVAGLFLTVYGSDSVKQLADQFRLEGYTDVPTGWSGGGKTIDWLRKMGFGTKYAGRRAEPQANEFIVPGAVNLNGLHTYQKKISEKLRTVLTQPSDKGPAQKCMVELPTGAGKTRVATETVLKLFKDDVMNGTVLWIAQSTELCEQAVQTFDIVWRHLADERPLSIGRLWENNTVHEPDTEFSVVVATDAKLEAILEQSQYQWLRHAAAVFVDEAHRAGNSKRYTQIFRWLGVDGHNWERPLVGLSATPFKGRAEDGRQTRELAARFGNNKLAAFESDAYRQLQKLEVLAKVKHEVLPGVDVDLSDDELRSIQDNRKVDRPLLERLGKDQARMKVLVNHILSQNPDWPILVFTPSVLSAQVLAATLRYRGSESAAISGQTGRQERRDVIKKFHDGEIRILANCDLLVQGFDAPGVRALYIARPTFSPSSYIQMAGRGLRGPANGGKEECLIVDVADNFGAVNDFLGYREYEDLWKEQHA